MKDSSQEPTEYQQIYAGAQAMMLFTGRMMPEQLDRDLAFDWITQDQYNALKDGR